MGKRKNSNWHIMATSAIKIDLRDYSDILSYATEVYIWDDQFRLDMIVIKKETNRHLDNAIAGNFGSTNLFEIKGIGTGISIPTFYKAIAYAALYASENSHSNPRSPHDITMNLVSRSYPHKLLKFLRNDCEISVENISPGVYHIGDFVFPVYIIVTSRLPKEDFLYLACATNDLTDSDINLVDRLGYDIRKYRHLDPTSYDDYVQQLYHIYTNKKGDIAMAVTKKVKKIQETNLSVLSRENQRLAKENENIPFLTRENQRLAQEVQELKNFIELNLPGQSPFSVPTGKNLS